jgi:RNA polymerase sigma-70 factor (ECF subfamily)
MPGTFGHFTTLQVVGSRLSSSPATPGGAAAPEGARAVMTSDEALMLEFQRGSREAFEELFSRYREPLYGFFQRRLASRERAEDLAQETFLVVIRATSRYEPRSLVRTYFYGIALKLLAVECRKQNRDGPARDGPTRDPEEVAGRDDAPDARLSVQQAIERLDSAEREILMLREYEQLSYSEMAELLRIPVNTVRSRLFRSRMALRGHLESATRKPPDAAAKTGEIGPFGKEV